ncbi:hypothetical protein M0R04_14350 [Candidatus Dojkabacteria bacterium]|jgi:hypothetical protein|nr:hypothetical protein [Candidatus Dojkabacteria bacterium]
MKITLQTLAKRVGRLEKYLEVKQKEKDNRQFLIDVMKLHWKHHGWTGSPAELEADRSEWKDTQELIDFIKNYDKLEL